MFKIGFGTIMARITVEDCILNVHNRFELVLIASKRARDIASGTQPTVARNNDKNSVISLREIAENSINIQTIREDIIKSFSKFYIASSINDCSIDDNMMDEQQIVDSSMPIDQEIDFTEEDDELEDETIV